jgi:hypothetical protein
VVGGQCNGSNPAQHRHPTRGHVEERRKPGTSFATEREPNVLQRNVQPIGLPTIRRSHGRYAFTENLAATGSIATKEAAHLQVETDAAVAKR